MKLLTIHSTRSGKRGFTLLLSVLVAGIVLAIGLSILNITLKEFILSGIARESAVAFYAADAGMECGRYWDVSTTDGNKFDVGASGVSVSCMGESVNTSGGSSGNARTFEFEWETNIQNLEAQTVCALVEVTKYYSASGVVAMGGGRNCPMGVECTRIVSRGYNKACNALNTRNTVERALRVLY